MDFFNEIKSNIILTIINIIVTLSVVVLILINITNNKVEENIIESNNIIEEVPTEEIIKEEKIYVDIKGQVKNPGVYEVDNNSKVIDIINIAGELKNNANTKYLNLSKKIKSESVIYIYSNNEIKEFETKNIEPKEECKCETENIITCVENNSSIIEVGPNTIKETTSNNTNKEETKEETSALININTADQKQLTSLSGIGDAKASAIIKYREEKGKFKSIEDIKQVSGISESLYEKIKEFITV